VQMNCMNCDHQLICRNADDDKNHVCSMYDPIFHKTNADRIRAMSDEELTEFLKHWNWDNYIVMGKSVVNDWLKQEVE